jgi:hypothetical protein
LASPLPLLFQTGIEKAAFCFFEVNVQGHGLIDDFSQLLLGRKSEPFHYTYVPSYSQPDLSRNLIAEQHELSLVHSWVYVLANSREKEIER